MLKYNQSHHQKPLITPVLLRFSPSTRSIPINFTLLSLSKNERSSEFHPATHVPLSTRLSQKQAGRAKAVEGCEGFVKGYGEDTGELKMAQPVSHVLPGTSRGGLPSQKRIFLAFSWPPPKQTEEMNGNRAARRKAQYCSG